MTEYISVKDLVKWLYENAFIEPYDLLLTDAHKKLPIVEIEEKQEDK